MVVGVLEETPMVKRFGSDKLNKSSG